MKSYKSTAFFKEIIWFFERVFARLKIKPLYNLCCIAHHKIVLNFLKSNFSSVIEAYKNKPESSDKVKTPAPIWVCWLQGESQMPPIVINCYKSIKRFSNNHPVILIDENNISDYISLSSNILKKFKSGLIIPAHFSDYVRMNLLKKYGGIWMDATLFCTNNISEQIFSYPIFSGIKYTVKKQYRLISDFRWTGFFLGTSLNNSLFFSFMSDMYELYYEKFDSSIDYILMDYFIYIAYTSFPIIKKYFDDVLPNNPHAREFNDNLMDKPFSKDLLFKITEDTSVFKLSHRRNWKTENNGEKTFYYYFLNNQILNFLEVR